MKLYQKLGIPERNIDVQFYLRGLDRLLHAEDRDNVRHANKQFLALEYHNLATSYYLLDNLPEARRWAAEVAPAVEDYFFGDWRRTTRWAGLELHDLAWWKEQSSWAREFQIGLAWGTSMGQWDRVRRLAEYPDELCARGDVTAGVAFYMALASFVRGERPDAEQWLRRGLRKPARFVPLGEALSGIMTGDRARVSSGLTDALRRHRSRARQLNRMDMACDMDATILLHLARRHGLDAAVPDALVHHLIRL